MRGRIAAAAVVAVALALIGGRAAHADDGAHLLVDRVALEPTGDGAELVVDVAVTGHRGQVVRALAAPSDLELVDGRAQPTALAPVADAGAPLALALVVQADVDDAAALPAIAAALDVLLAGLGDRARVAILPYGGATGAGKLLAVADARARLRALAADDAAGPAALLDTLDRAIIAVHAEHARRVVVVIGDGRDRAGDDRRVTELATRAAAQGVRIDAVGYAATGARRPLLALGELARRAQGVFRWVETGGAQWAEVADQLRAELAGGVTARFAVVRGVAGTQVALRAPALGATTIALSVPAPACGDQACPAGTCAAGACVAPRSVGRRVLWIAALAVAVLAALGALGFILERRRLARHPAPALVFAAGERAGQRVVLRDGFTIGRAKRSHLVIDDGHTSNRHAVVRAGRDGAWRLVDLGSKNGTLVDGARVDNVVLAAGVTVTIGKTALHVVAGGAP